MVACVLLARFQHVRNIVGAGPAPTLGHVDCEGCAGARQRIVLIERQCVQRVLNVGQTFVLH